MGVGYWGVAKRAMVSKNQQGLPAPWLLEKVTVADSAHRTMTFQGSKKRLKYSYKSILGTFKYFQCKGKMSFLPPKSGGGWIAGSGNGWGYLQRMNMEEEPFQTFHVERKVQLTSNLTCLWKLNLQWSLEKLPQGRDGHCRHRAVPSLSG